METQQATGKSAPCHIYSRGRRPTSILGLRRPATSRESVLVQHSTHISSGVSGYHFARKWGTVLGIHGDTSAVLQHVRTVSHPYLFLAFSFLRCCCPSDVFSSFFLLLRDYGTILFSGRFRPEVSGSCQVLSLTFGPGLRCFLFSCPVRQHFARFTSVIPSRLVLGFLSSHNQHFDQIVWFSPEHIE